MKNVKIPGTCDTQSFGIGLPYLFSDSGIREFRSRTTEDLRKYPYLPHVFGNGKGLPFYGGVTSRDRMVSCDPTVDIVKCNE